LSCRSHRYPSARTSGRLVRWFTADALARARPLAALLAKYPARATAVKAELQSLKVDEASAKFLTLIGRGGDWVVILDNAGRLGHDVPAEGFF
jgi:hypothetical protein